MRGLTPSREAAARAVSITRSRACARPAGARARCERRIGGRIWSWCVVVGRRLALAAPVIGVRRMVGLESGGNCGLDASFRCVVRITEPTAKRVAIVRDAWAAFFAREGRNFGAQPLDFSLRLAQLAYAGEAAVRTLVGAEGHVCPLKSSTPAPLCGSSRAFSCWQTRL